MDKSRPITN